MHSSQSQPISVGRWSHYAKPFSIEVVGNKIDGRWRLVPLPDFAYIAGSCGWRNLTTKEISIL